MRSRSFANTLSFSVVLISLLAAPVLGQARQSARAHAADRFDGVRALIHQLILENDLPSISVAVAKDGRIEWEEAFGWADREQRVEATPHTMYSLASISKPITATGLMILAERGLVELDRPVNEYLGAAQVRGLAGDARDATVRRVLNHSAGLPLHYQFFYENGGYGVPTMAETIARYAILALPPGERVQYSNLGFGILDYVIARRAGVSYAEFMRSEVFIPLGMTRTSVGLTPGLESHAAVRYDRRQRRVPFYEFDHDGASAVWSSAHDLVRFGMFHLKNRLPEQRRILADSTVDAMKVVTMESGGGSGYAISWNITRDDHGFSRASHSGGMPGVSTVLNLYPTENLAVVVLANTNAAPVQRVAGEIAAAMLPRYAANLRARQAASSATPASAAAAPDLGPLRGEWAGELRTYDAAMPLRLVVQPDGDVHVRLGDQLPALLDNTGFRDGNLTGRFAATIPTADVNRHRHLVQLNVWLRDGRLSGQASAMSDTDPIHYALTSYVELSRRAAAN